MSTVCTIVDVVPCFRLSNLKFIWQTILKCLQSENTYEIEAQPLLVGPAGGNNFPQSSNIKVHFHIANHQLKQMLIETNIDKVKELLWI